MSSQLRGFNTSGLPVYRTPLTSGGVLLFVSLHLNIIAGCFSLDFMEHVDQDFDVVVLSYFFQKFPKTSKTSVLKSVGLNEHTAMWLRK